MKKILWITLYGLATVAGAQEAPKRPSAKSDTPDAKIVQPNASALVLDGGFDLRARFDGYDNLPNTAGNISPAFADYYRLRSRVWGSAYFGDAGLYARLANEFRGYDNYAPSRNYNAFPDQLFVDNLYLDLNKLLFDRVDLRIGRQDLKYGAGRVIADGTPADGSRSAYFDAIKASVRVTDKTTADFFGMYTKPVDNFLTMGDGDGYNYNLTSYDGALGPNKDDDLTEWGAGTYWTVKEYKTCPMEFYLLFKDESRWHKGGNVATTVPGRQYATLGTRLTPKFSEKLTGEFEGAYQFGQTDSGSSLGTDAQSINAYLLYGGLTYTETDSAMKPYLTAGTLYLSGDDRSSAYDTTGGPTRSVTGWNPVYGRQIFIGDLPVKMYGSSHRWSNLIWPYLEPGFEPVKRHKFKLQSGPMFADKNDYLADSGSDLYRGWYSIATYECTLLKEIVHKRGEVKGRLQFEHMAYGSYYERAASAPDNGYFFRAEVSMAF